MFFFILYHNNSQIVVFILPYDFIVWEKYIYMNNTVPTTVFNRTFTFYFLLSAIWKFCIFGAGVSLNTFT